ncbi:MAG: class I SAM-dependent methyltransferase [Methylococcales bacterium]
MGKPGSGKTAQVSTLCLNVGCGLSTGPSWLNIDASPSLRLRSVPLLGSLLSARGVIPDWPSNVTHGNITRGLRIARGSCELVFASHVFEHLPLADFDLALANIKSYLKQGAVMRLIMPDLYQLADSYLRGYRTDDSIAAAKAAPWFNRHSGLGAPGSRKGISDRLKEAASNARHQWLWDRKSIHHKLLEFGFSDITFRGYGEWSDERFAEVEDLERHSLSFCLECAKS